MNGYVQQGTVPGMVTLLALGDDVHVDTIGVMDIESQKPMRQDTISRIASMTKLVTAVAMLMLNEEGAVRLDDPVEKWLPELAHRKVLRRIDGPIADTVPAKRSIRIRDLMTMRAGYGAIMGDSSDYPIQQLMEERGLAPGADGSSLLYDEWLARFEDVPLLHQPGEAWHYDTAYDILGILISRVTGKPLSTFFQERIFGPLDMRDTGFFVPEDKLDRLPTCYMKDEANGKPVVHDPARGGLFTAPPNFESGAGGLVSTADDFLTFARMLLNKGEYRGTRLLSAKSVEDMTTDHLTREQKDRSPFVPGFWDHTGWGYGVSISISADEFTDVPGRYGWDGGYGTSWTNHPALGLVMMVLTQQLLSMPVFDMMETFYKDAFAAVS
jgi:CubicO group peptidase (beta-lactamase class C family)